MNPLRKALQTADVVIADNARTEAAQAPTAERFLFQIAADIRATWPNVYFGAVPYLDAMRYLQGLDSHYGMEQADDVVLYFLSNAKTWRGEDARRIKAELQAMLKAHKATR